MRSTFERSWDDVDGVIAPKSRAGVRTTPIPAVLREYLLAHKLRLGRSTGLFFGRSADQPFNPRSVHGRAERAWREAGLEPISLHECRHTFASLMIASGVNVKALSVFMGHSSTTITWDRYGHLFPGAEDEAAALLDAHLAKAAARKLG